MPEKLSLTERGAWSVPHQHQHRQRKSAVFAAAALIYGPSWRLRHSQACMTQARIRLLPDKPDCRTEGWQATHNSTAPVTAAFFVTLSLCTEPCLACGVQVQFGELPDKLYYETEGQQTYYITNSTGYTVKPFTDNYYLSPSLHHVLLQNLKPGTTYYYR